MKPLARLASLLALLILTSCNAVNPGIYKDAQGKLRPKQGFVWANPGKKGDYSVKPAPGYKWKHPKDKSNFTLISPTGETINPFLENR
jgi:hypothetical protein